MLENMIRIIKPRGAGKTTSLLKLAKDHGYIFVATTDLQAKYIKKMADDMGCQEVPIISFCEFMGQKERNKNKYLIDELDLCLKSAGVCGYSNTELDDDGNEVIKNDHL